MDEDFLDFVAETNIAKGVYNIYINEGTKIAMCCRFINDMERMSYRTDSFGNGGLNIGSHRIVTINFARIALIAAGDFASFFSMLEYKLDLVRDLLLVHREEIIQRRIDAGFLKFFKPLNWFTLDMFFSTIGINGLYEMTHFMGVPMETEAGQEFTADVLKFVEEYAVAVSRETGYSFNTEEIPGESTAVCFAKKDRVFLGMEQPYELYSNQYVPLIADFDPIERIKLSGKFMSIVSGGGIVHLNLKDALTNPATMKKLIKLAVKAGVPHFAVNYSYGICENEHVTVCGTATVCPVCGGSVIDHLTRVIGYFTKTSSWHQVRREYEFPQRKFEKV